MARPARTALAAGLIAAGLALGGIALAWAVTPHDHVAGGCSWWTARQVGDVHEGDGGCVRGYVFRGGLGESRDAGSPRLNYDTLGVSCPWRPGDAVVARYKAIVDDGRVILQVTSCR